MHLYLVQLVRLVELLDVVGKGVAYWRTLTCDSKHAEYMAVRSPVALRSCDERRNAASG